VISNELRDFRLGGAELPAHSKHVEKRARTCGAAFHTLRRNVLDATNAFALLSTTLASWPACQTMRCRCCARPQPEDGRDGYKISLHSPSYTPVLQ